MKYIDNFTSTLFISFSFTSKTNKFLTSLTNHTKNTRNISTLYFHATKVYVLPRKAKNKFKIQGANALKCCTYLLN